MSETEQQLLVRFRGICGHLDLPYESGDVPNGKKKKRTVLVRHRNGNSAIEPHLPYIEFYADDLERADPKVRLFQYTRPGMDGRFARIDVEDGTVISFRGLSPGWVEEELNYTRDVPRISEIVKNGNAAVSKTLLKETDLTFDWSRATAVFDMPAGRLFAGEPEALITRFPAGVQFQERRLARWSDLYITCKPPLVLQLNLVHDKKVYEVEFKKTLRMLTIGNEPERLILGVMQTNGHAHHSNGHNGHSHGSGNGGTSLPIQPTGHYVLYYELLDNPPAIRPVPIPTQLTGTGCPNNNFP